MTARSLVLGLDGLDPDGDGNDGNGNGGTMDAGSGLEDLAALMLLLQSLEGAAGDVPESGDFPLQSFVEDLSGHEACMQLGLTEDLCSEVGCCEWQAGGSLGCSSAVGAAACSDGGLALSFEQFDFEEVGFCSDVAGGCGVCEICDSDADCGAGLWCLVRSEREDPVPGCAGSPRGRRDYCYDPVGSVLVLDDLPEEADAGADVELVTEEISYAAFVLYQRLGTVQCDLADMRGYDDYLTLRAQLDAGQFVDPGTIPDEGLIYSLCPGTELSFYADDLDLYEGPVVLPPLRLTSSLTTLRCGDGNHASTAVQGPDDEGDMPDPSDRCTLRDGLTQLIVEPGLSDVNVLGLDFSGTRPLGDSVIVRKYDRGTEVVSTSFGDVTVVGPAKPVNFEGCTWAGNAGNSAIFVDLVEEDGTSVPTPTGTEQPTYNPTLEPTKIISAPNNRPTETPTRTSWCYSDWAMLREDVASGSRDSTYHMCPDTVFDLRTDFETGANVPFYITTTRTVIKCGLTGRRSENCFIYGNTEHFIITGRPRNVRIEGVTMLESNGLASIIAAGDERASVTFVDCAWFRNTGQAVVLIASDLFPDGSNRFLSVIDIVGNNSQNDLQDFPPPAQGGSMSVNFEDCIFRSNNVEHSVVTNWGGKIMIHFSQFSDNEALRTIVGNFFEADASVRRSCFTDNKGQYQGTVFMQEQATLSLNSDNYGADNDVGSTGSACREAWNEGPCPVDGGECSGECDAYSENRCMLNQVTATIMEQIFATVQTLLDMDRSEPTSSPSLSPSLLRSEIPSRMPSSVPSSRPSLSAKPSIAGASSSPSSVPSETPSSIPSRLPSSVPSLATFLPSSMPSFESSTSGAPIARSSSSPSSGPSERPSSIPSRLPSSVPSSGPSLSSKPSRVPSSVPSSAPSQSPSSRPSRAPKRARNLQEDIASITEADVFISRCAFRNNIFAFSVIDGGDVEGAVDITESTFRSNTVSYSVVAHFNGRLSVEGSCFEDNDTGNDGVVFVGRGAFEGDISNNYGFGNDAVIVSSFRTPCNGGILIEDEDELCFVTDTCQDECIPFDAETCQFEVMDSCNEPQAALEQCLSSALLSDPSGPCLEWMNLDPEVGYDLFFDGTDCIDANRM